MRILIVDDSRIMRNIVKNSLVSLGYEDSEFMEAGNGAEAFSYIERNKFDLVLLDWNMPMLNGLKLVTKLRNIEDHINLPIIVVTSEAAKYNVIEAVKAGVNDYLVKPISEKHLGEKIKRVLGQE